MAISLTLSGANEAERVNKFGHIDYTVKNDILVGISIIFSVLDVSKQCDII